MEHNHEENNNNANGVHHSKIKSSNLAFDKHIDKNEFVRVIIQALDELGYKKAADTLESESGVLLQKPNITKFCQGILEGSWEQVEQGLSNLKFRNENDEKAAKFAIHKQKFLEYLEGNKTSEALQCLRNELTPLSVNAERLHKLSTLLICTKKDQLYQKANWDGSNGTSRKQLLHDIKELVSPEILLHENRLQQLVEQGLQRQLENCLYHNTLDTHVSLYSTHHCSPSQLPSQSHPHILESHQDEVWYVKFSHNGKFLASASKDCTAMIWDLSHLGSEHSMQHSVKVLKSSSPLSFLSWSPDDRMLLTCGSDDQVKLWDTMSGKCIRAFAKHTDSVTSCAWFPDGKHFVTGGVDRAIYMLDIDGNEVRSWNCARVNGLVISPDGNRLIVICQEKKIRIYDIEEGTEDHIQETDSITSLDLADDGKHLLVNVSNHEIHVWNLETKALVQRYRGQKQSRLVIHSCFGGANQAFVASGSEDSQVYLWHRDQGTLLHVLAGHSGTVNAVSWNPVNPYMLASCSDDLTIRLWMAPSTIQHKDKSD